VDLSWRDGEFRVFHGIDSVVVFVHPLDTEKVRTLRLLKLKIGSSLKGPLRLMDGSGMLDPYGQETSLDEHSSLDG
jgi:hypothetical protein